MDTFKIKTEVVFGEGSLAYLETLESKKIFLVTDPFMVKSGGVDKIKSYLIGKEIYVFDGIVPDPPIDVVVLGIEKIKKFKPEVIIALGGGSAIDATKAIMDFSKKIMNLEDVKMIAIPTTSGTGSEVTSFAVITDKEKGVKYPLVADSLLPDIALLEPELVRTVPNFITADTGMDVLTHAIEAYVSIKADDFSDALAEKAVELAFAYLLEAYKNGNNIEAREKMHNASCLAGLAFNKTSLGLNHGIAHVIGGKFHIPHGRTNALLLPHIIEFNADIQGYTAREYSRAAQKYAKLAKLIGLEGNNTRVLVKKLIDRIRELQKLMNMPTTLTMCKVDKKDVDKESASIAELAMLDACTATNPREAKEQDIRNILNKIK
ncbi:MAG: 1-propanol dehydrogenase PduQ [Clostridium sp.]|uniref:1-propanol dehydrogenase PduQ n=1 Tax=Clostridium sp. TaxID=1506 RepID=UPI003F2A9263